MAVYPFISWYKLMSVTPYLCPYVCPYMYPYMYKLMSVTHTQVIIKMIQIRMYCREETGTTAGSVACTPAYSIRRKKFTMTPTCIRGSYIKRISPCVIRRSPLTQSSGIHTEPVSLSVCLAVSFSLARSLALSHTHTHLLVEADEVQSLLGAIE